MKFDDETWHYTLSTGKTFYSYSDLLCPDGKNLMYGHDGTVNEEDFTSEERREIADAMIERWNRWAATGSTDQHG